MVAISCERARKWYKTKVPRPRLRLIAQALEHRHIALYVRFSTVGEHDSHFTVKSRHHWPQARGFSVYLRMCCQTRV